MLLRFEVGNHRSIRSPVELSMVAVDKDRAAARDVTGVSEPLLTVAAIYGPNGSGKTNLIDALTWLSFAVAVSLRHWEDSFPLSPFSFSAEQEPTRFDLDVVIGGVRYRYELEVEESRVVFEALYSYPQKRSRTLFEREGDKLTFRRGSRFSGGGRELVTSTTLVLSVASRLTEEIDLVAKWLRSIDFAGNSHAMFPPGEPRYMRSRFLRRSYPWDNRLIDMFSEPPPSDLLDEEDPSKDDPRRRRQMALSMLKFADLGICDAEVTDETPAAGPGDRRLRLLHDISGNPLPLELDDESDGTLAWLGLIPELISVLVQGGLIVVDELDASLHPVIAGKLVEFFQDPSTNPGNGQIIFSTHDTSLLTHLNRDEVWLTEKGPDGSTELIPLSDFRGTRVRPSTNLERGYLQGRFGGVPLVDEFLVREAMSTLHQD